MRVVVSNYISTSDEQANNHLWLIQEEPMLEHCVFLKKTKIMTLEPMCKIVGGALYHAKIGYTFMYRLLPCMTNLTPCK